MAVVDDLFQLIRSLTPSEKRYFKIHAKTHVAGKYKNNYEKLFDAMNFWPDEEEYDEKLFKRKHKGKSFLKNLSSEKNYLYELILETMRSFHNEKTIDRQINDLLLDEDFFRQKRLNEQRKKAIDKAKKLAKSQEKIPALLTLIEREINMQIEWQQQELKELAAKLEVEERQTMQQLQTLSSLRYFSNSLFIQIRMSTVQSTPELQRASTQIVADPLLTNYRPGTSFNSDLCFYRIHAAHNRIHLNLAEHERYSKLIFELLELHYPSQKEANLSVYKKSLYNYLNACFAAGNLKPFPELLEKARLLSATNPDEEGEDWQNLMHLQLIYYNNTAQLKESAEMAKEIETGLKIYKNKVNKARELALYYNLGAAFFVSGNWGRAIDYYNKIVSDKTDARLDLKENSELMLLVAHFETKNYDVLEYLLRNTERRFEHAGKKEVYKPFFRYLRTSIKENRPDAVMECELSDILKRHTELLCWAQGRQQKRKIEEIYSETALGPF